MPFPPTFAGIARTVFALLDGFGLMAMSAALADEISYVHAGPFPIVVEDLVDGEKVVQLVSVVGTFHSQFTQPPPYWLLLTAGQRHRLRHGAATLGEELSFAKREALRSSAEGTTINGERSPLVSVDDDDGTEAATVPTAVAAGHSDAGPATPLPRDVAEWRRG